ncbi:MAG: ABC transporter permease subunit, partial [Propionibacteriaceae bacterium]
MPWARRNVDHGGLAVHHGHGDRARAAVADSTVHVLPTARSVQHVVGTPAAGHLHRVRHTFLIRQSFLAAPSEYGEAARIEGAGEWRVFWDIYLPLARPALA